MLIRAGSFFLLPVEWKLPLSLLYFLVLQLHVRRFWYCPTSHWGSVFFSFNLFSWSVVKPDFVYSNLLLSSIDEYFIFKIVSFRSVLFMLMFCCFAEILFFLFITAPFSIIVLSIISCNCFRFQQLGHLGASLHWLSISWVWVILSYFFINPANFYWILWSICAKIQDSVIFL